MRKTVLSLMSVAALALAGCSNAPDSSQPAGPAAPASAKTAAATPQIPNQVSGTISLRAGTPAPSANATLVLNLADVSSTAAGSAPLASKTAPAGTFPQPFTLSFNPAEVKPNDLYVIQATLTDGDRKYTMPIQAPVLAKGSKNDGVAIELVAEQTPSEKILAEFAEAKAQIGGMKISHGTKLEANDSRGWQLFRQAGEVKYIREEVDYGDKGYTSTDYAYKGDKPWAIVQETKASRDGKPSAIDRAGWSDDGTLVLKQHQVGGDVQPLDPAVAATLKKQAMAILGIATGGKNK
ncbi:YbaY family lipoprotein [Rhodanobacter sp. B2A1Ga4]|uniref:YbaY family lipoprotein n=1 Tax=Rhodanobacter TaxID=75309 RepID=UPI000D380B39|nr:MULTISPECIES: YbaY family lipoprotein [Rhodanobacter]MBQ4856045.1 YbaY family lipoprotein [Rhodanobacter sp. B2A1Ga4]